VSKEKEATASKKQLPAPILMPRDERHIPGKPGKKPFVFTKEVLERIEYLAKKGFNQNQIHKSFGISHETWYRHFRENTAINEAYQNGKTAHLEMCLDTLERAAKHDNSIGAAIFLLKARHGFRDNVRIEQIGTDTKTSLNSHLNSMSNEELKAKIQEMEEKRKKMGL
jgi:hypothetical protein